MFYFVPALDYPLGNFMRILTALFWISSFLLHSVPLRAEGGRIQVLEYKDRGGVLLFDPESRRLWECDSRSIDRANPSVRDCQPRENAVSPSAGEGGLISVDSEPRGAEVYIDSEYQGTTPLQNLRVTAGNVPIALVKDGFMRQNLKLVMKSGERRNLGTIKLTNRYGEVYINSMPPRATVTFDGERIKPRTPLTIRRIPRDKAHVIRLDLDGYRGWERSVDLEDKDKKKYDVQLEKEPRN